MYQHVQVHTHTKHMEEVGATMRVGNGIDIHTQTHIHMHKHTHAHTCTLLIYMYVYILIYILNFAHRFFSKTHQSLDFTKLFNPENVSMNFLVSIAFPNLFL